MVPRNHVRSLTRPVSAGIIALLLIVPLLFCGCLDVEPEELPPQTAVQVPATTVFPTIQVTATGNASTPPPAIVITRLKKTGLYTEQGFPPEVENAVSDFAEGKTTDTINGFLRWESVRARTSKSETASIREQVRRIDYAVFNTPIQENISLYVGVSGEQAKRIRNESVFSEDGYIIASYDPSIVYHRLANSGRDNEGYLTMCVIDFRRGNRLLFVNASEREFLIPRGGIWDVSGEETYRQLEFSADSVPRYDDIIQTKVRLISTKEHP